MKDTRLIGLIAALALLFSSCDRTKDLPDNELQDGFVAVRVRSLSVAEDGSESLARTFSQREPEIVTSPIGNGMLLEMSIKQDDSPLRDKVLLEDGKKFRVIAVEHGTNEYYSHGDFTVGESGPDNDFLVKIGEKYDYICISYNSETALPPDDDYEVGKDLDDALSIGNANDILWCRINKNEKVPASPDVVELDILLKQKLSKVRLILSCDYNKWKIGVDEDLVSIEDVAVSGTLDLSSGDVTSDTPEPQTFTSFTSVDAASTSQTSNELKIMPKANSTITITISAGAVSRENLNAIPTTDKQPTLTTPLDAGSNYVITLQLRVPIFARSNIYWDNTAQTLTFVPAEDDPADNDDTKAGYQGVFFKWGSLVGISPALTEEPESGGTMSDNFLPTTPLYVPVVKPTLPSSTWKATTGNSTASDTDIDVNVRHNYTVWTVTDYIVYDEVPKRGDIPFMHLGGSSADRSNAWLIDDERNNYDVYKELRGDICQYLSTKTKVVTGNYRLPTPYEFGTTNTTWAANVEGWESAASFPAQSTSAADGTANMIGSSDPPNQSFAKNTSMDNVIFPASGYRENAFRQVGSNGFYWSGSTDGLPAGHILRFNSGNVYPYGSAARTTGRSVRCVKK
jgi:hypothetical protein